MKNLIRYIGVISLLLFSFYYTDKAVEIIRRNDPIMQDILSVSKEYEIESINAKIEGDTIIPGLNGLTVDIEKSYQKMKNLDGYYESLLMFKDVIPDESIIKRYDKFITHGNTYKNEIALIIKITNVTNLENIKKILDEKKIKATFFIDGTVIEKNMDLIRKISEAGYEIENLGYNYEYSKEMFNWTNNMIYSITNIDPAYCYTENKNYDVLNMCEKNKMHTVNPNIVVSNNPYITIKNTLNDGNIISLKQNEETLKELPTIISYIRQKGFDMVSLSKLISEESVGN